MRLGGPSGQPMPDYIAEVAAELFRRDGIRAVGVDRVAHSAGLTKRTLYRHFRSKDDLVAAMLRRTTQRRFPSIGSPLERITGAFGVLEESLSEPHERGCASIFFAAELR